MADKKDKKKKKDDGDGAAKKKGGLIPNIALMLAVGAASFGTVYFLPRPDNTADAHDEYAEEATPVEPLAPTPDALEYIAMDPLTLSLDGNKQILKIGITLEARNDLGGYVDPHDPKLLDAYTGYLRALRVEQIEDAAYMAQMRRQLVRRANLVFGERIVHSVLITDFLVR